ncbi:hypothetical protein FJ867_15600 [Mesorhizobium sp. B2-5-3]|nr:hypothetical protein FJ867_15600 [Mesorhizobium sp. B2-5-3]
MSRPFAPPSVLPDISPTRGEISASAPRFFSNVGDWRKPGQQPISPPVGEMAGRPEGGAVERHHSRRKAKPKTKPASAAGHRRNSAP